MLLLWLVSGRTLVEFKGECLGNEYDEREWECESLGDIMWFNNALAFELWLSSSFIFEYTWNLLYIYRCEITCVRFFFEHFYYCLL